MYKKFLDFVENVVIAKWKKLMDKLFSCECKDKEEKEEGVNDFTRSSTFSVNSSEVIHSNNQNIIL